MPNSYKRTGSRKAARGKCLSRKAARGSASKQSLTVQQAYGYNADNPGPLRRTNKDKYPRTHLGPYPSTKPTKAILLARADCDENCDEQCDQYDVQHGEQHGEQHDEQHDEHR